MELAKKRARQYLCSFFCVVLAFSLLPLPFFSVTAKAETDVAEELPYETDSLFVKLAVPANPLSLMSIGDEETAEAMEWEEAVANRSTIADYGDISLLFDTSSGSGAGISVFSAVEHEAWYGLKLNDGQDVDEVYAALKNDPNVLEVNYNYKIHIADSESTVQPLSIDQPMEETGAGEISTSAIDTSTIYFYEAHQATIMENTGVTAAQNYLEAHGMDPRGSSDVVVAILDSGIDCNHPELADNILKDADGNIIGYDATRGGGGTGPDENFNNTTQKTTYVHGTHCAGIVAAKGINVLGVASHVKIMPVTVISSAKADFWSLIDGIKFAVENGADIINMSIGTDVTASTLSNITNGEDANALHDLIKKHYQEVLFVAAAGNQGSPNETTNGKPYNRSYPAVWPEVFAVMNTVKTAENGKDWLNSKSNWDVNANNEYEYNIMAPGTEIASTVPDSGYSALSGTSQAAPFVSGCLALLLTQYKDGIERGEFTMQDMLTILTENSEMKQGITYAYIRYNYPYVRIDNALSFRTELDIRLAPYHYFFNGVSSESDIGVSGAASFRKDTGKRITRALDYDYIYEIKHLVENTGDYIIEESKTIPRIAGSYDVKVNVDDIYYTGNTTAQYTVFDRQGDFNGDGQLSYMDMETYAHHLGTRRGADSVGSENYEPLLDLNSDGKIDISDVQTLITMRYQESLKNID